MSRRNEEGFAGAIRGTASLEIKAPEPSPYSDLINVCLDLVRGNLDTYVRDVDAKRIEAALVAAGVPLPEKPEYVRAPVWVAIGPDELYLTDRSVPGYAEGSTLQWEARRFDCRVCAWRWAHDVAPADSRVVRLVPRKRGGR